MNIHLPNPAALVEPSGCTSPLHLFTASTLIHYIQMLAAHFILFYIQKSKIEVSWRWDHSIEADGQADKSLTSRITKKSNMRVEYWKQMVHTRAPYRAQGSAPSPPRCPSFIQLSPLTPHSSHSPLYLRGTQRQSALTAGAGMGEAAGIQNIGNDVECRLRVS